MLLGRTTELKQLTRYYEQEDNSLVVVYGQKGIGINEFLQDFLTDKEVKIFCGRAGSEREQLYLWSRELQSQGVDIATYPDFSMLFSGFTDVNPGKRILWIQDFQYFVKNGSGFMDALTEFLNNRWNMRKTMIILSSSHIGWVENGLIPKIGKAAFLISGFVKLKPLNFLDLVCYFDGWDTKDCIITYGILGGIERYWRCFDRKKSVKRNICEQIITPFSYLYEEWKRYLFHELREDSVYNTVLASLAEGRNKLNALHLHTGFSRAKLSVYLKNLMELEIVEKVYSYETGGWANTQKGVYRISNPYMQFCFRYLYPNMTQIGMMSAETFYQTYIKSDESKYYGTCFVKVCREYLSILNERNKLPIHYTKIGEWVGKAGNIDIVAQDENSATIVGMCNWEMSELQFTDYEWFLYCIKEARLQPEYIYLFSVGGFDSEVTKASFDNKNITLIDMKQL